MLKKDSNNIEKIVLVGGCFDILHFGHTEFLRQAKSFGAKLVVLLESDENVRRMKGQSRPIHSQLQRKTMLDALKYVDEVIILPEMNSDSDYRKIIESLKPSVIAVTEGDPIIVKKKMHAESIGAKLIIIPKIHTPSTSQLAKLLELE